MKMFSVHKTFPRDAWGLLRVHERAFLSRSLARCLPGTGIKGETKRSLLKFEQTNRLFGEDKNKRKNQSIGFLVRPLSLSLSHSLSEKAHSHYFSCLPTIDHRTISNHGERHRGGYDNFSGNEPTVSVEMTIVRYLLSFRVSFFFYLFSSLVIRTSFEILGTKYQRRLWQKLAGRDTRGETVRSVLSRNSSTIRLAPPLLTDRFTSLRLFPPLRVFYSYARSRKLASPIEMPSERID